MKKLFLLALITPLLFSFRVDAPELLPTSLRITILNELGNQVEGASVTLFETDEDYRKEENQVMETQLTDAKGRVTFKDLAPKVYFVLAEKEDRNNNGAGVQTDTLSEGKMNKVNIIIE